MAVWELALLFVGVTVFTVNMVNMFLTLHTLRKYGPLFDKSVKILDKMLTRSEKIIDEELENE